MKKRISLLLVLCVLLSVSCCALAEETDYTGLWKVCMVAAEDRLAPAPALPMSMEFFADGKAVLTLDGQNKDCTWAAGENGVVLTDNTGSTGEFPCINNMLVYLIPGGAFYFAKETDTPVSPADYLGVWKNTSIEMGIYLIDPVANGQDFSVTLKEEGVAVFSVNGREETGKWAIATTDVLLLTDGGGMTKMLTFANDTLTNEEDGILMIFTRLPAAE